MRLTVLGCYGPYPAAGQNCSGYLLQDGTTSVLLDCGNGVLSQLRYHLEPWQLNAVILSHLHSDHMSDVMIMRYAMLVHHKGQPGDPLKVFAPEQPAEDYARLHYKNHVTVHPLTKNTDMTIGSMHFSFFFYRNDKRWNSVHTQGKSKAH